MQNFDQTWFALLKDGTVANLGGHENFDAAGDAACDLNIDAIWLMRGEDAALLAGSAGLAAGYYLTNKYNQYKNNNKYSQGYGGNKYYSSSSKPSYHYPTYTNHHQSAYKPSYPHKYQQHQPTYPVYNQYQQSYRPPTYNRYQTSTSSSSRPTYYRAGDLQARSDSTCIPYLVFSVGGNHLYKCRGQ